jgi:hypothetical protein
VDQARGAIIRATAEKPEMVDVLGIDARRLHDSVRPWRALALVAGVLAAPLYSVYPNMGDGFLIISFVVVVIGGLGSVSGRSGPRSSSGSSYARQGLRAEGGCLAGSDAAVAGGRRPVR